GTRRQGGGNGRAARRRRRRRPRRYGHRYGRGWHRRRRHRRRARRRADGVVQLGGRTAHLIGDALRIDRSAHHARRDQQDQLALLEQIFLEAEEIADDRDLVEDRDPALRDRALVLDQSTEHQRLVVEENDGRLRLTLVEGRRIRGRHWGADGVHLLLDIQGDRAALA